jgi:CDP-glycerol glycerophosphotransferase
VSKFSFLSPTKLIGALRRRLQFVDVNKHYKPGQLPLTQTVLFESFQGKVIADSPLAIFEELRDRDLGLDLVWAVNDASQAVPRGSRSVVWGSHEWLALLASAKYLVNNANYPFFFRKAPGQVYLQTWHGTPLKKLGRDVPNVPLNVGYQATMEREARTWDYLVSPNEFFASVFPKAFCYEGKLISSGYPRNDILSKRAKAIRGKVRDSLGLSSSDLAILYAPTWRDYKRTGSGDWEAFNYWPSDVQLEQNAKLLFRGHHNTMSSHSNEIANGAIDVTHFDDIAELYLAADVLVTDYSSSMFDFSVTGKPMIFFAPDLERYRSERGFYLDYEDEVPGPVVRSASELQRALGNLDEDKSEYKSKYAAWRKRFNALDDGQAAKRVVDQVWGN